MDDLHRIRVYESYEKIGHLDQLPKGIIEDVTEEFITGPPGWQSEELPENVREVRPPVDTRNVFVVHGRNNVAREAMCEFLRAIKLWPLEWSEVIQATGKPMPYIGEILETAFALAQATLVLITPDDEVRLRKELLLDSDPDYETNLTGQAGPNVLYEAGMAMGMSPDRTVLVELGTLRPFTDVAGLHVIRLNNSPGRRKELAQRLISAGCPANLDGNGWYEAGDFKSVIESVVQNSPKVVTVSEQQSDTTGSSQLSEDALELLVEAAKDGGRTIRRLRMAGGLEIATHGRTFFERGDVRSEARWEQAIKELIDKELIEDQSGEGKVLRVTQKGFEVADRHLTPK